MDGSDEVNTPELRQAFPDDIPSIDGMDDNPEAIEMETRGSARGAQLHAVLTDDRDLPPNRLPALVNPPQANVLPQRPVEELHKCKNITEFVEKNVFMRHCTSFIKNPKTNKCGCNRLKEWHVQNNIPDGTDKRWSSDVHTSLQPTNAHGKIKLHGYGRLRAGDKPKYIRVDALMQEFETVWDLLVNHWKVPTPDIILSINGGAKKMAPMTQRLKVALKRGLINVSTAGRTWFITTGFNLGVAKLVGEAVREYSLATTENSFVAIGLTTWGAVYNREQLVNNSDQESAKYREEDADENELHVADYYNYKENPGKGQAVLDPHHTHFILCDDGSEKAFNKEISFRAQFENFVGKKMAVIKNSGSPVVQVVIEGGKKTIETAYAAVQEDTPVVVIKGSGRCADLICDLLESTTVKTSESALKLKIHDLLEAYQDEWGITKKEHEVLTSQMLEMCRNFRDLLHIFNVDGVSKELDRAILLAVFKSSKNMTTQAQLTLAMNMDRCDLAAQEIFSDDKSGTWKNLDLEDAMFDALRKGQTGFVELFLDHGISIENFLTKERLTHLYHHALTDKYISREGEELREMVEAIRAPWWNFFVRCCRKVQFTDYEQDLLPMIGRVIQVFTGDTMPNPYSYSEEHLPPVVHAIVINALNPVGGEQPEVVRVSVCGGPMAETPRGGESTRRGRRDSHVPEFVIRGGGGHHRKVYPVYPPRTHAGKRLYTEQDLFLWSVLLNKMELAKVFWRMGKDHIGSALVACSMLDNLQARAESDGEMELAQSLGKNSDYFEMVATGILSMAYQQDKERAHLLLIRCLPYYGNETLLSLADQNECMDFMSHTAAQTKLNRIWMGGMSPYVPLWKIILNLFFSIFFIRLIFPVSDSGDIGSNKVEPQVVDEKHMLHAEYIDQNAPNARELRETMAAKAASAGMDPKSRETFLDQFRWRQQHAWKHVSYLKALYLFYTAPLTKFMLNTLSYVILLLLFCYLITVELKPFVRSTTANYTCGGIESTGRCLPPVELITWIWIFTLIIEEFRQVFMRDQRSLRYKLMDWISSGWNKFDCALYLLFATAILLRFLLADKDFIWNRSIYALIMSMLFLRFMQTYYAHRVVGPKVVMITKMVNDILFFVAIFIIFLLAYGTAAQSLLYPNSKLSFDTLKKVVYFPYWQVFGELTLDEVNGKNTGQSQSALVVVLFAIYMLFTNVLLLNLLIAMFGYTFENIQGSSLKIWSYNRYDLILEFFDRPFLPPPFIILPILYRVVVSLITSCRAKCLRVPEQKPASDFKVYLDLHENQTMSAFEQQCMERLMTEMEADPLLEPGQEEHASHKAGPDKHISEHQFGDRIEGIADQVSMLKDIIDRKGRYDSVLSEGHLETRTPRNLSTDAEMAKFAEEVNQVRERLRGLEDKLTSQTKIMENIHSILEQTLVKK